MAGAGPCQMISPLWIMAMRSAILRAETMSWVIEMVVAPNRFTQSTMRLLMTSAMIGSRPVVGLSKKMICGEGGDRAGRGRAVPHAARELGGIKATDFRPEAHLPELLHGDVAGFLARRIAAL